MRSIAQYPLNQRAGELSYALVSSVNPNGSPNIYYRVTLKMVLECDYVNPGVNPFFVNNFDNPGASKKYEWLFDSASNTISVVDPCIAFSTAPCYRVYYYHNDIPAEFNHGGYSIFYSDCCRDYYQNINFDFNASIYEGKKLSMAWGPDPLPEPGSRPGIGYVNNGIVYLVNIPSRFKIFRNSSPQFDNNNDTVLYVCKNDVLSHTFGATDPDGDSLVYSFMPAKTFYVKPDGPGTFAIQTNGNTQNVIYSGPLYTASQPLGEGVEIDSKTAYMRGVLRDTGSYLITIGVNEYRNGQLVTLTPHTRDVVVKVFDCSTLPTPKAILPPLINNCNSTTVTLQNNTTPYHPELYWDNNKYLWDLGDGDTAQTRNPVHTYDTGTYNIRLITMPGYHCADTAYTKLLVYPSVHPSFTIKGQGCTGQPIKFTNTSSTDIGLIDDLKWVFTNLKDSTSFTTKLSTPTYTFKVPEQTYAVVLDVTTTKGCEAKDTQYINIWQSPLPLTTHDTIIATGAPYSLYPNSGSDTSNSTYTWSPATDLDDRYAANPTATGTQEITYKVQMHNSFGCSLNDTVHIKYYKGPEIYMPAAFTPNGDGINDIFRPFSVGIQKLEFFRVYSRWGDIVYQTEAYTQGWNGMAKGRQAPAGTYVWEVRGRDYNNKTVFKKGTVLLVR